MDDDVAVALVGNHCRDRVSHSDKTRQLGSAVSAESASCHTCSEPATTLAAIC